MDATRYFIRGRTYLETDPGLQEALARVYETPERPRCMCVPGGVEMYVAKYVEFVVKRMPATGERHHPTCPSFEPEPGVSGLGELMGEAIVEHGAAQVEIRTDFPLCRLPGKGLPRGDTSAEPAAVSAPRRRMSLRAVLHLLYHRAGLNRWYPAMQGKRSQGVVRKYLELAAAGVTLKGESLDRRLYVPEPFRVADKDEIAERRRRKFALMLSPGEDGARSMAIVVGQFNGAQPAAHGRRILVKHMPDAPLHIDEKAWERAERAYATTLQAADADVQHKSKVVLAALVYARRENLYQVDALTMMLASDQWVPLEGLHELPLVEELQRQGRSFIKPLRFDSRSGACFPNVLLLDAEGGPVALHVASAFLEPKERRAKERALQALGDGAWVWRTDKEMRAFPARGGRRAHSESTDPNPAIAVPEGR